MLSIIRLDILFETISLVISFAIALAAFAGSRKTGSRSLTLLSIGFFLMAGAMLLRVVLTSWALTVPLSRHMPWRIFPLIILQTQELVYSVARVGAYAVFLHLYSSYSLSRSQQSTALVAITTSLIYNPFFEAVSAVLLAIVVYQLFKAKGPGESSFVIYGFILLLVSHLLFLALPVWLTFYFVAQFLQLVALTLFLTAVLSVFFDGKRL
ncbi:MAG: hypothetical protein RMI43_00360 [Candidatus Caldarchaeum sp.]|nr:hypothetical protein [Candidatus Caldarchaeum sp.]MDW8062605.1 hypothetical protein [Candidatus Caldarchaeum sp.]MDW8435998.1 hypothetical protein [Candidatus Caldarchaeum sp.]